MSPLRYILPALSVASTAYAGCSVSGTTTLHASADAAAITTCQTFSGSIALATDFADIADLSGIELIEGGIHLQGLPNLTTFQSSSLRSVVGQFYMNNVPQLSTLDFPMLTSVSSIFWQSLANLYGWTLTSGISKVNSLWLSDTKVNTLSGLNLLTAESININNNGLLQNISMQLANVSGPLTVSKNGGMPDVSFPDLIYAVNITLVGVSQISVPALKFVNQTFGVYESSLDSFATPKLETVGGLALVNNAELSEINSPSLSALEGGSLSIVNDTKVSEIIFPKISQIKGAVQMTGAFTAVSLPKITNVAGAFTILSSKDLGNTCNHYEGLQGNDNVINGLVTCSGKSPQATEASSTTSSSSSSQTSKGAAPLERPSTPIMGGMLGFFLAIVGLL